uniref:Uncharacterized protein n=1 Tax=Arundo donax TaxID=35708 RepID=A0A0A9GG22_ARUDO
MRGGVWSYMSLTHGGIDGKYILSNGVDGIISFDYFRLLCTVSAKECLQVKVP